jgi:hypothetical protein
MSEIAWHPDRAVEYTAQQGTCHIGDRESPVENFMNLIQARTTSIVLCMVFSLSVGRYLNGQQPEAAEPTKDVQLQHWRSYYAQVSAQHKFLVGDKDPMGADLRSAPLHFFSNPAGGTQSHGSIHIWTNDSRPVVLGAIWSRRFGETRRVSGSFHSTSLARLEGKWNGTPFWQPGDPIEMKVWPQETTVARSLPLRLVQMKNMMRALEATRFQKDERSKMRVLSQPLYRYRNSEVMDGAIFGFFENWDPELFVLVEARVQHPDRWVVGMIRFSNKRLDVKLRGKRIWEYDPEGTEPPLGGPEFLYVSKSITTRPHLFSAAEAANVQP